MTPNLDRYEYIHKKNNFFNSLRYLKDRVILSAILWLNNKIIILIRKINQNLVTALSLIFAILAFIFFKHTLLFVIFSLMHWLGDVFDGFIARLRYKVNYKEYEERFGAYFDKLNDSFYVGLFLMTMILVNLGKSNVMSVVISMIALYIWAIFIMTQMSLNYEQFKQVSFINIRTILMILLFINRAGYIGLETIISLTLILTILAILLTMVLVLKNKLKSSHILRK